MKLPFATYRRHQINLLPRNDFESSVLGVFLGWVLTFGKWAVIVTQLVVVTVFITRFWYDRQLTDLRKEIAKQAAIVKSYSQIEEDFVLAQKRTKVVATTMITQAKLFKVVDNLQKNIPADLWLERLTMSEESAILTGSANSLPGFSQFVRSVTNDQTYSLVNITNLQDGSESGARLKFDMTLSYKQERTK